MPSLLAIAPSTKLTSIAGGWVGPKILDGSAALKRTLVLFAKASNVCSAVTSGLISVKARFQMRNPEITPLKQRLSASNPSPMRKLIGVGSTNGKVAATLSSRTPLR